MKKLKGIVKKVIIVYVIIFFTLSSLASTQARTYDSQCGEYVSQYARDFIEKYCTPTETKTRYALVSHAEWSGGSFGQGTFIACCNTGVKYMYELALGVMLEDFGWTNSCSSDVNGLANYPQYWEDVTGQTLEPGDIVLSSSHTEMYVGNNQNANFGNSPHAGVITVGPRMGTSFTKAYRPKFDCNPTGTIPIDELEDEDLSIYDDNGFIYKGVASLQGYKSSEPLGKWIISMLSEILDYLIGMLTYIIRAVIVGWTAIIERFVVDGIVNAVTGVTNKRDPDWDVDPNERDDIDAQADQDAQNEAEANGTPQSVGNPNDPTEYISSGMQQVADIGGAVQLKTTSEANVTVENIVYNKIPILDINFFNFESAGGAVVDEDGIIYIIKENVAFWYYIFRILAILIMLAALIYLGIRMALTTVTEKKAIYKQMMLSWLVGFILIFAVSYIMYLIINVNETFVEWIIPRYEDRTEISLYESVKTKAYSLKATTGFTGMIMYIVLVYYAIRFLFIYFKRFVTIMILALISPFISVAYAIEGINKKGKGGAVYKNWFKSFSYTVIMQSIHALIYTIFILLILKLTQVSLVGIMISFVFLHYMVEIDVVFRKVFGFTSPSGSGIKPILGDRKAQKETFKMAKNSAKGIGRAYGNYLGKTVGKPLGKAAGKIGEAADGVANTIKDKIGYQDETVDKDKQKKAQQEREENRRKLREGLEATGQAAKIAKSAIKTAALGTLVIPSLIADPAFTAEILGATLDASAKTKKLIGEYSDKLKARSAESGKKYRLQGIRPSTQAGHSRISQRLQELGLGAAGIAGIDVNGIMTPPANPSTGIPGAPGRSGTQPVNPAKIDENTKIEDLTEEQKAELLSKIGTTKLKLIDSNTTIADVLEETQDIEQTKEYAELLAEVRKKEQELEEEFKKITDDIASKIEETGAIGGEEFAKVLREKAAQSLATTARLMSKPLSEKDIFRAMQGYQSKVPQFKPSNDLSQADIEGITKELNKILSDKNEGFEMTKEFKRKIEKEITESQRKAKEEQERIRKAAVTTGQDMSGHDRAGEVAAEDVMVMRSDGKKVRRTARDVQRAEREEELRNPNAATNRNAPQQNATSSEGATERLVKNIMNASKSVDSKRPTAPTSQAHIEFSRKLDELRSLADQLSSFTGEENTFDIDDIFRRLEAI